MAMAGRQTSGMVKLKLARDLVRTIKRGNPWVYAEALVSRPRAAIGAAAILLDPKGKELARGFYDPYRPLAFRVCSLERGQPLDEAWMERGLQRALALRRSVIAAETTGYRLVHGEGDGLPGLICDVYGDTAVLQFDGEAARGFWNASMIAAWLERTLGLRTVYEKPRGRADGEPLAGTALLGAMPREPVPFVECGAKFTADIVSGQKTGFFLDQRENRQRVRQIAAGRRVLNVFGYTGGFSICAGLGGAAHVITVDIAQRAIETAALHWNLNNLPAGGHEGVVQDAFTFLEQARERKRNWDLVVLDPPSFAPSQKAVPGALAAYQRLIAAGAAVTANDGLLAAASCSSHVRMEQFMQAIEQGVSDARRRATVLEVHGQPADHPAPLALPEFRYLKFVLLRIDGR